MCVICELGKIVKKLEKLAERKLQKNETEHVAQASAAMFLIQAAQASLTGEWGIIDPLIDRAHECVSMALLESQCSECGNSDCPRNHDCEHEDIPTEEQPN